ncbi:MAG: efflux RND transporter permease subunit [Candidatus Pacebacteria bacterium]|nr:efflux RND transporter permease subunit [Candidatus Paceibacterota bacterium]MBP9840315.1 efflux RND transporter permease subunit [Candidatus Paceibacterota bacterium]
MTSFWTFFLRKRSFTILLAVVLTLAGVYSALGIPKESAPEVQIPLGIITTVLPGASAEDVERLITDKIEDRVLGIEGVSKVTSSSGSGVSSVQVEFVASADIDKSIQLLKDEVDKINDLPEEAEDPSVTDVNFADQPILIISIAGDLAQGELTLLGEEVRDELERIPGVSSVGLSGVREREISVVVRQDRLRQYGLSASDVTNAIHASGVASPLGSITVSGVEYAIRLESGANNPDVVGDIALTGPGGTPLRVRDVADVVDGLSAPRTFSRVSVEGEPSAPALTLSIYKSRGGNILATGTDVREKLEELKTTTLAGTETVISYDAAKDIQKDLTELTRVGLETVVLVLIMLFLTLGWRESLAAALSIPLSFLIAFIGMWASGNTINFISLFSLILAIGILVDSGIVVVEAIHTRLVKYGDKQRAAIEAIREYAWPLVAGTFTTIAVFVPLFFLSGIVGKFIASIPFTVIFVLLASIFVALGLVPLIAIAMLRSELSPLEHRQEEWNEQAKRWYAKFLRGILDDRRKENRFLGLMVGLFVLAIFLPAIGAVKTVFFPPEDMDFIYVELEKPQGTTLTETDLSVREAEELLYGDPNIASFVSEVGAGSAFGAAPGAGAKRANITVNLHEDREVSSAEIVAELRERMSAVESARVTVTEPSGGPPTGTAIAATFTGEDLGKLSEAVNQGALVLASMPGVVNVQTSTKDDGTEFVIRIDAAKAVDRGVSPLIAADTLRTALFGAKALDIRTGEDEIEVRTLLDLNPEYRDPSEVTRATIEAVQELTVTGSKGPVPLSSIASVTYESAESVIRHEDGKRIATISADVSPETTAIEATNEFLSHMEAQALPEGVFLSTGGESEDVNQSFAEMGIALLAGAALMLAILVLEFNSFRYSFYLLSIIPLSLIGVLVGLMITGAPLSFPSMLGVIALAGVIINHAIILMDSIAHIHRNRPELSTTDVVVEAASVRFRPIILTTVVTVVGMIPLSFASSLWGPLAFSIMFGLAWSMVLTLILIPVLYHRWPGKGWDHHSGD